MVVDRKRRVAQACWRVMMEIAATLYVYMRSTVESGEMVMKLHAQA